MFEVDRWRTGWDCNKSAESMLSHWRTAHFQPTETCGVQLGLANLKNGPQTVVEHRAALTKIAYEVQHG